MENTNEKDCPDFKFFGAPYIDATCIDGYLWDLDKYEDGSLYGGGDIPCPFCNKEEFKEHIDLTDEECEALIKHFRAQITGESLNKQE